MKYWGVAQKLKLLEAYEDAEKFNLKFSLIFWIGLAFNSIAGLLFIGILFVQKRWFYYLVTTFELCIFVSCGFLVDAFRVLSNKKAEHQVISKRLVTLLSIAFGAFGMTFLITIFA
jgi:hypothetical protein